MKIERLVNATETTIKDLKRNLQRTIKNTDKTIVDMNENLTTILKETDKKIVVMNKEILKLSKYSRRKLKNLFEGEAGIDKIQKETRDLLKKMDSEMTLTFTEMKKLLVRTDKLFRKTDKLINKIDKILKEKNSVLGVIINDKKGAKKLKQIIDDLKVITDVIRKSPFFEGKAPKKIY